MTGRVVEFRVGVLVLVSLVLAGILALLFGDLPRVLRPTYTIFVEFPDARGVRQGSPVRKSGVLIGRVTDVEFAEKGGVRLTLEIDSKVALSHNEVCEIRTSLLGDAELHFVPASTVSGPVSQQAASP
jgi:phospholipid/cholesterol/gamma-HCH transport system substrate-binding protein